MTSKRIFSQNFVQRTVFFASCALTAFQGRVAFAQNSIQAEDHFREIFLTAGYSAIFGAAAGAALLPFFPEPPSQNLRYVAGGASLGFIFGSAFAFYNISQNQMLYSLPQESQDPYETSEQGNTQSRPSQVSLPKGALIVGSGSHFGLSFPAFQLRKDGVKISLAHLKF